MKKMLAAATVLLALLSAPAMAANLTTTFDGGNGQNGNMFNVSTGASAITLTSLVANIQDGASYVGYYRLGGIDGNQNDAAAWTQFTTNSFSGTGQVSIDISDLVLAANSTYGLYLTLSDGSVSYTDGTGFGNVAAQNGDLTIFEGYGKAYAFADTFEPRIWNGTLNYTVGTGAVPEPATWAMMLTGFGLVGAAARRNKRALAAA